MYENNSLIEIAIEQMNKKRKPQTLNSIAKEVFEMKGLKISDNKELLAQFEIDFMLCGYFICCSEDKKGNKLWDLKSRQHHELQDKEGVYLEDPYEDDEDVKKNELKDDIDYLGSTDDDNELSFSEEEEDDVDDDEKDDIEEELGMINDSFSDEKPEKSKYLISEDDDDDESEETE